MRGSLCFVVLIIVLRLLRQPPKNARRLSWASQCLLLLSRCAGLANHKTRWFPPNIRYWLKRLFYAEMAAQGTTCSKSALFRGRFKMPASCLGTSNGQAFVALPCRQKQISASKGAPKGATRLDLCHHVAVVLRPLDLHDRQPLLRDRSHKNLACTWRVLPTPRLSANAFARAVHRHHRGFDLPPSETLPRWPCT